MKPLLAPPRARKRRALLLGGLAAMAVFVAREFYEGEYLSGLLVYEMRQAHDLAGDAARGDRNAQFRLGRACERGSGVPRDPIEAYKWLNLSAAQGVEPARWCRDRLARWLKPEEVAEAQRRAAAEIRQQLAGGADGSLYAPLRDALRRAAKGKPSDQRALAAMYEAGRFAPLDFRAAIDWYRKAARQDDAWSQF